MPPKKAVVATTQRGVFFGYTDDMIPHEKRVILERARVCVGWTIDMRGFIGLAALGPSASCRISPAAPRIVIEDVTAVVECSATAAAQWEKEPWRK